MNESESVTYARRCPIEGCHHAWATPPERSDHDRARAQVDKMVERHLAQKHAA